MILLSLGQVDIKFFHCFLAAKRDIERIVSRDEEIMYIAGQIDVLNIEFVHFIRTVIYKSAIRLHISLEFKAAYSVTFDLLILELMCLFFKNTVKK